MGGLFFTVLGFDLGLYYDGDHKTVTYLVWTFVAVTIALIACAAHLLVREQERRGLHVRTTESVQTETNVALPGYSKKVTKTVRLNFGDPPRPPKDTQ